MSLDRAAILGGEPLNPAGPPPWPIFDPAVTDAVVAAMADGSWGRYLGPHCGNLREALAAYHDVRHVHLCSSGTSAVELALRGVNVGPGDEVILAAYDFEANFKDVLALGAIPVLVDVRADDAQLDVKRVEEAAGDRVKAVIASHLHGGVVDVIRLRDLCDRRGWSLIDDACQAPGAFVLGRRAGTWGDAGVLSFGGSKLLTAGRGGCVLTSRDDVLQRIRLHVLRGNDLSPLSELQAVALLPQLARLDERNAIRTANVDRLRSGCAGIQGLTMFALASGGRQPSENVGDEPPADSRRADAPR
ncbi:MAG: aminotransferase class V-fold PLP-dependent enzyme, partial [Planctomycetaceae bacterium]